MYVKVGKNIKKTSVKGQFEDVQAVRIRREAEILDVLDSPKWGIYST